MIAATAHMNERWPDVTPDRIRAATARLISQLDRIGLPLAVFPTAEVTVRPDLEDACERSELLTVADRGVYLLIELPPGVFLDLRDLFRLLRGRGIRPVLAHPERHPELLYDIGTMKEWIRLGCVVQVSSESITDARHRKQSRVLRRWVRQGLVHLIASDGHTSESRPPRMAAAYRRIAAWAGTGTANRICCTNGLAVLAGLPLRVASADTLRRPPPESHRNPLWKLLLEFLPTRRFRLPLSLYHPNALRSSIRAVRSFGSNSTSRRITS